MSCFNLLIQRGNLNSEKFRRLIHGASEDDSRYTPVVLGHLLLNISPTRPCSRPSGPPYLEVHGTYSQTINAITTWPTLLKGLISGI